MKEKTIKDIIKQNEDAYNAISDHFDVTRPYLWYGMDIFLKYTKDGDKVLDFGCGNGRFIEIFKGKKIEYFGVDISGNLLKIAREKYNKNPPEGIITAEYKKIDSCKLPFGNNFFDNIYSIAVFHHIPSKKERQKLLKDLHRVLKPGGRIILTNWNLWQRRYIQIIFKYVIKKILGQTKLDFKGVMVPWKDSYGKITAERYYYAFTRNELRRLIKRAGFEIEKDGYFGGNNNKANLYIVAKKI
jgi:alkylated DNA repair protein alkB family protein 8